MIVDKEVCSFGPVTFDATIGSSRTNSERTSRRPSLVRSATCEKAPCGIAFAGQEISLTLSAAIGVPKEIAKLATTIVAVSVATDAGAEWLFSQLFAR